MCRLLGYDENELLSLSVRDIHPPSVQDTIMENFRLAAEGRLQIAKNVLLLRKDGGTAVADVSISRFSFNERPCLVGLFHDITDRKKMEKDLRRSREEPEFRVLQRTRELANAIRKQDEYFKNLRLMTTELTKTEQRERQQLARILHDGLQQHPAAAGYQVELIRDSEDVQKDLNKLKNVLDEASETACIPDAELSPPILLRRNLFPALEWQAEWMHIELFFQLGNSILNILQCGISHCA
jgi:PAS domain S-box-containing protein